MNSKTLKSVVLIGGGHTHALVLNNLKKEPLLDAQVTVINPAETAPYSGMLPGFVAGHYSRDELDIDLKKLSKKAGATIVVGRAISMDLSRQTVVLENGTQIPYDLASVDVGITSRMKTLAGFKEHAIPAKPLGNFSIRWDEYRAKSGSKHVVIIGGGIAGAELAMAMAHALQSVANEVSVKLLDRGEILSSNSDKVQSLVRKELKKNNVVVTERVEVVEVNADAVVLANGSSLRANFVVGAAGATPHPWLSETGLTLREGFVVVNPTLETSQSGVFAVGDCAHMACYPRPKAGVYAVRQAPVLLENLRRSLTSKSMVDYSPQSDYLKLVSLGGKRAFGEKQGWSFSGNLVWRLKNYIDRSFMNQF